jgi:hypothetical protein
MSKFIRKRAKVDYECVSPTPSPEPAYADNTSDTEEIICEKAFRVDTIKYCNFCSSTDNDDLMRIFTECSQCGWTCNVCHKASGCLVARLARKKSPIVSPKKKKQRRRLAYNKCTLVVTSLQ